MTWNDTNGVRILTLVIIAAAAACKAVGEVCLSTAGDMSTCCTGTDKCTDLSAVTTEGVKCAA